MGDFVPNFSKLALICTCALYDLISCNEDNFYDFAARWPHCKVIASWRSCIIIMHLSNNSISELKLDKYQQKRFDGVFAKAKKGYFKEIFTT